MIEYNKAIVEVLEIIKYLDDDVKQLINYDYLDILSKDKDLNYHFEINKDIPLYQNHFLNTTIELLEQLFK